MDEMKIKLEDGVTKGVISRLVSKVIKKKLGLNCNVAIENLDGTLSEDNLVIHANIAILASKKDLIEKVKGELL